MDDVDAVQAQIARNMLTSGDWVIARLDGVPYLEKSPLVYWLIAFSYKIFGFHASINVESISSALIKIKGVGREHNVAFGSIAAGSGEHQVWPCPLCLESGRVFRAWRTAMGLCGRAALDVKSSRRPVERLQGVGQQI